MARGLVYDGCVSVVGLPASRQCAQDNEDAIHLFQKQKRVSWDCIQTIFSELPDTPDFARNSRNSCENRENRENRKSHPKTGLRCKAQANVGHDAFTIACAQIQYC